jgi:hypothetical protein
MHIVFVLSCHDPNLTMSLHTFMTPPFPPGTPLLLLLNTNTHAGILPASALSNLMRFQNANIDNLINGFSQRCQKLTLLAMAKFLGRVVLLTKQTMHPSSQGVYL